MVIIAVEYGALDEAWIDSVVVPLDSDELLNEALTPEGNPETDRLTEPALNDFTCTGMVATWFDMPYGACQAPTDAEIRLLV